MPGPFLYSENTPVRVLPGAKITLCNVDTQLVKKDSQS